MTVGTYRYDQMTWPEIREVAAQERVVVVPIGTLEDHGPHLPIDTDVRIIEAICARACAQAPDRVVLLPVVTHGYSPHHSDFPGSITSAGTRSCATSPTSRRASSVTGSRGSSWPTATARTCRSSTWRRA